MPTLRQRRTLREYATRQDKRLTNTDHRGLLRDYMRGIVVIGAALLLWLISDGIVARLI